MKNGLNILLAVSLYACGSSGTTERIYFESIEANEVSLVGVVDSISKRNNLRSEVPDSDTRRSWNEQASAELVPWILTLDSVFADIPFYIRKEQDTLLFVASRKRLSKEKYFDGQIKYGLYSGKRTQILPTEYDKISNPDLLLPNVIEVKQNNSYGLFHLKNSKLLEPQFEVIYPNPVKDKISVFGLKDSEWFEISYGQDWVVKKAKFNPANVLAKIKFDIRDYEDKLLSNVLHLTYEDEKVGAGVLIIPSYLSKISEGEEWNLFEYSGDSNNSSYGINGFGINTSQKRTLWSKIESFFIDFYEFGIQGRDYDFSTRIFVSVNSEDNVISNIPINGRYPVRDICSYQNERFLNDSTIEVVSEQRTFYSKEPKYSFFKIEKDGNVFEQITNRHFSFTKFILIGPSYFECCLYNYLNEPDANGNNIETFKHYSIEDLDIMRNEIFAEYGLIFKSEKWQKYFSSKDWYKPLYDNVDHFLTEIDKKNIEIILKRRKELEKNEAAFRKRELIKYYAPG